MGLNIDMKDQTFVLYFLNAGPSKPCYNLPRALLQNRKEEQYLQMFSDLRISLNTSR
jgi:hypothetical protein